MFSEKLKLNMKQLLSFGKKNLAEFPCKSNRTKAHSHFRSGFHVYFQ